MTAVIQSVGTYTSAGGVITNIPVPKPTGLTIGDLMVAKIERSGVTNAPVAPAGWTLIRGDLLATACRHHWFWKIAEAADVAAAQFVFTTGGDSVRAIGGIARITGHDPAAPINAHGATINSGNSLSHVAPSVSTTVGNCLVLRGYGTNGGNTTFSVTGATELWDLQGRPDGSGAVSGMVAWENAVSPGATVTRTATPSVTAASASQTVAVAPAPLTGAVAAGTKATRVTIDGTTSTGTAPLTYAWLQTAGPTVTLDTSVAGFVSFNRPDPLAESIIIRLTVSASDATSDVEFFTIDAGGERDGSVLVYDGISYG